MKRAMRADPMHLLADKGASDYGGEPVTQLAHALQSAAMAEADGASDALVVAALLHDLGHLIDADVSHAVGGERWHETLGARALGRWYGPEVTEPVRLHVLAKRYLARDPDYLASLTDESKRTLGFQGGPFSDGEAEGFLGLPHAEDAIRLRQWDDRAKDPAADVPGLEHYAARVAALRR
jgi:phosphonate degradation associated HDIG domain protein